MRIDPRLARQIEVAAAARKEARSTRAVSVWLRHSRHADCAQPPAQNPSLLLSITERLIDAHALARLEGDGMTIDVVQDALHYAGRRLAQETNPKGGSARKILGHYRQERDGGLDRNRPNSGEPTLPTRSN